MKQKIAFITGASRGIGRSIALKFAENGYHLGVNSKNSPQILMELSESISSRYHVTCIPYVGDASDYNFMEHVFADIKMRLGTVDVLINNAGISHVGLLSDMVIEEWNQIINTNLTSVFCCCKFAIPQMVHNKAGKIINISSVWGNSGASCEVAYSASKGGMNAFTKALAKELGPSNIQVNAVACGVIDTQMNSNLTKEDKNILVEEIPSGRFGTGGDVADLVYDLAKSNSYLTGQVICIDGGWT